MAKNQLIEATKSENLTEVKRLLSEWKMSEKKRYDPNAVVKGETALHCAAEIGNSDIIDALVYAGAEVNVQNQRKETPLILAVIKGHFTAVQTLLQQGANINLQNSAGWSPLYLAARYGHKTIVDYLLRRDAKLLSANPSDWSPFFIAMRYGHSDKLAILLTEAKQTSSNNSPIYYAVKRGDQELVKLLISYGADIKAHTNASLLLSTAVQAGDLAIIECLYHHGASLEIASKKLLSIAKKHNNQEICEFLSTPPGRSPWILIEKEFIEAVTSTNNTDINKKSKLSSSFDDDLTDYGVSSQLIEELQKLRETVEQTGKEAVAICKEQEIQALETRRIEERNVQELNERKSKKDDLLIRIAELTRQIESLRNEKNVLKQQAESYGQETIHIEQQHHQCSLERKQIADGLRAKEEQLRYSLKGLKIEEEEKRRTHKQQIVEAEQKKEEAERDAREQKAKDEGLRRLEAELKQQEEALNLQKKTLDLKRREAEFQRKERSFNSQERRMTNSKDSQELNDSCDSQDNGIQKRSGSPGKSRLHSAEQRKSNDALTDSKRSSRKESIKKTGRRDSTRAKPMVDEQGGIYLSISIPGADVIIGQKIGEGSFGVVYKGTWQHCEVAVKQLHAKKISERTMEKFRDEVAIMVNLRHPNVIQCFGACFEVGHYSLVMEYMPKGSLFNILQNQRQLPWSIRYNIAMDVASGLSALHAKKILHRDLKSLNVLLDDHMRAKLTDFGLSKVRQEANTTTGDGNQQVGTIPWMAPELFQRQGKYTSKADIYSFGMILWELASRTIPFAEGEDIQIVSTWIMQGEQENIPEECQQKNPCYTALIKWCWNFKSKERPSIEEAATQLKTYPITDDGEKNSETEAVQDEEDAPQYQDNLKSVFPSR